MYSSLSLSIIFITSTDQLQQLLIFLFVYKEENNTSEVLKLKELQKSEEKERLNSKILGRSFVILVYFTVLEV